MKTFLILLMWVCLSAFSAAMVETPEEEAAGREKWSRLLKQAPSMPIEERIPLLQSAILKLSQPSIYADREKAEPLFRQARDLMAATPGYGDYYVRTLGGMQEEAIKSGPAWNQFHTDCDYALATLKLVPTAESVRALSELLDYDKTRDVPMEGGPLAGRAAYALFNMIENPPARGYHVPWKQWRERVREGRETFQLKGSEIRYNFEGPIETTDIQPDRGSPPLPTGHAPAPAKTAIPKTSDKAIFSKGIAFGLLLALGVLAGAMWKLHSKARV